MSIVFATILSLPAHTAIIGDGWLDAIHPAMLVSVANETTIGTAWWCRIAGSTALLFLLWRSSPYILRATALVAVWLLASLALTGHAAMGEGIPGIGHQINDTMHLLAAGAWFGALPVVLQLLPYLNNPEQAAAAQKALRHFSVAGHFVVVLVILSGIINLCAITGGSLPPLTSAYSRLLETKILVTMVMVLLAIVNRYYFVPRMYSTNWAANIFRRGLQAEIILALTAILLVACFGMLDPG